ncbi:hypothetical protein ES705_27451 [subsurface metagenome]
MGNTEVEIIRLSDIVLLVLVPGMGDEIQAMKAGVMEIGDIYVINKKDRSGAEKLKAEVDYVLGIKYLDETEEKKPVVMISAKNDDGIDDLSDRLYEYFNKISSNGFLVQKRKDRIAMEMRKVFAGKIHDLLDVHIELSQKTEEWVELIYSKKAGPYTLINAEMDKFMKEREGL